jgi:hypothetical protein
MAGLSDAQTDGAQGRVGRDGRKKLLQALKGVGLEPGKMGVHGPALSALTVSSCPEPSSRMENFKQISLCVSIPSN